MKIKHTPHKKHEGLVQCWEESIFEDLALAKYQTLPGISQPENQGRHEPICQGLPQKPYRRLSPISPFSQPTETNTSRGEKSKPSVQHKHPTSKMTVDL
jgi:hypothetical protein